MKTLRCAIYTRKSSEEGLEQSFNSLHAQRAACEAYVLSQAGEGWVTLPRAYDDGGFSGGSMERPGLAELLRDVEAGRIDVVVVYKVDRLTRSLTDFARIVDVLDKAGASFVSVTQAFNTTSSMGRLTLNVLLSFAQFEREVTGERIRDKIAASKARGMWMGGNISLGYDLHDRLLQVNEAEAEVVRDIFRRYLELRSVRELQHDLQARGVRSKSWLSRSGRIMGGVPMNRGGLYHLLNNRLYVGEIKHGQLSYPGLHAAILPRELFDAVQTSLANNRVSERIRKAKPARPLLTGLVYDAAGEPMCPSFAYGKKGRFYRYYIALELQKGGAAGPDDGSIRRVSAEHLERALCHELGRVSGTNVQLDDLPRLLRRVELRAEDTHLVASVAELFGIENPDVAFVALARRLGAGEQVAWEGRRRREIRIVIGARMKLRGGRTWLEGAVPTRTRSDPGMIAALRSAHAELLTLKASPLTPAAEAGDALAPANLHRRQLSRIAFLAPDLQRRIMDGTQPAALTLRGLLKTELPLAWSDQRIWFDHLGAQ